ncbi:hypothetical protein [Clostridium hydrogenum]|uniref:hypothetical protein n=1 Tax=Clostridium hydrogenum TaxID=2855764 RepID=UPI001F304C15|nr:hypothetical protein [Clostridium hydrogenum]
MKEEKQAEYAGTCSIISLILVIIGFIIPIWGAGYIVPIALVLCAISLKEVIAIPSVITLVIAVLKLIISPTFWVHLIGIGGLESLVFSWGSVVCIILSIYYLAKNIVSR